MIEGVSHPCLADRIDGSPLSDAEIIVDFGILPVPGLFFNDAASAAGKACAVKLLRSRSSGLIQLDRDLNGALYEYYKSGQVSAAHRSYVQAFAVELAARHPVQARILEIGGGQGYLMRALREQGFTDLHIVDPSAEAGASVQCNVIHDLFPGDMLQSGRRFDVIIAQHFLEHSPRPVAVLAAMQGLLSEGGYVYIEVPDIRASALEDNGEWLSATYALHSTYFSAETLTLAVEQAGLCVEDSRVVDHYGKSLVARLRAMTPGHIRYTGRVDSSEVTSAIVTYFNSLRSMGARLTPGLPCWGAAERCLMVLGGLISGGFAPGVLVDSNPEIQGKFPATADIAVQPPTVLSAPLPELVVLAVPHARKIVEANPHLIGPATLLHIPTKGSFLASELF